MTRYSGDQRWYCLWTLPFSLPQVTHVVLFDFPNTTVDYLHRVGRTGRVSTAVKCRASILMSHRRDVRTAWLIKVWRKGILHVCVYYCVEFSLTCMCMYKYCYYICACVQVKAHIYIYT